MKVIAIFIGSISLMVSTATAQETHIANDVSLTNLLTVKILCAISGLLMALSFWSSLKSQPLRGNKVAPAAPWLALLATFPAIYTYFILGSLPTVSFVLLPIFALVFEKSIKSKRLGLFHLFALVQVVLVVWFILFK